MTRLDDIEAYGPTDYELEGHTISGCYILSPTDFAYLITVARAAEAASVNPMVCYDCTEFVYSEPGGDYWNEHDCPRVALRAALEGEPR